MISNILWHVDLPDKLGDLCTLFIRNTDLKAICPRLKFHDDFIGCCLNLKKIQEMENVTVTVTVLIHIHSRPFNF